MVKSCSCCDNTSVKKGPWSPEEDWKLIDYVTSYGHWNWRQLPKFAGLLRCGKSCRLRWKNYLKPNIRRGNYTKEEEEIIIKLYKLMGGSWSAMAIQLPGRTDNDIKNHWNTVLKRRVMKKQKKKKNPLTNDEPRKTSDEEVMEQETNYFTTFIDLAALESALESIELLPSMADDIVATATFNATLNGGIDMSVDDYFSSDPPPETSACDDFWRDPFWENFFDTPFDDNDRQLFGESNVFVPLLDELQWQEGIY